MKLNNENYFSIEAMTEYMSASQFKAFEQCESAALANLVCEEEKKCYLEGKYFEACIRGNGEQFLEEHTEMISSRGVTTGELKSNFKGVQNSVEAFQRQDVFLDIVAKCEQQVIITGTISDIKFKGCIDFYDPETGNGYDSKLVKDFKRRYSEADNCYVGWYFALGYHYQAAIYKELIWQTFGKVGKQHLIAATKELIPDVAYLQFTDQVLKDALDIVRAYAPVYDAIKKGKLEPKRCGHCDHCKQAKVLTTPEIIAEYE